jgi:hypothetical protein
MIGQESTTTISRMILYILYFTVKEKAIFDWGKLISIEISSQLSQYKRDKKFFMASYLVFVIAYCCQFPKLSICKRVNCEVDPITFWYQALWRHNTSLHFYEVYNDFISVFKGLLFGKNTPRISDQENKFLEKKGTLEKMENHNVIRIFVPRKIPLFFHTMYLIKCLLWKWQGNIIYGCTFSMRNGKINSYPCLGKLETSYSRI